MPGWRPPSAPGVLTGAAHKPGAVALRPLSLGDIYDAAFKIIRYNPGATVGAAVLVAAAAMALPVLVTAVLSAVTDLSLAGDPAYGTAVGGDPYLAAELAPTAALLVGSLFSAFGLVLVTGMICHTALAAALGRRLRLGEAWAATHGRRWRLVGLALLQGLMVLVALAGYTAASVPVVLSEEPWLIVAWFVLTVPLLVVGLVLLWVRVLYLAVPALMLERTGVLGSLRRAVVLTRRQFWRTFGIGLLTAMIVGFAGQVLATPVTLVGTVAGLAMGESRWALLVVVATQAVGTVLATAFTTPFQAAVTSVQYLDQRIRKEGYDVELMTRAGLTPPPSAPGPTS